MKKATLILTILAVLFSSITILKVLPLYAQGKSCLSNYQNLLSDSCLDLIKQTEPLLATANKFIHNSLITNAQTLISESKPFWPYRDYLLGNRDGGTSYLFLLQNNYELRPQGGFPGSYVVINIKNGQPTFRFGDIYTPDGQLPGHVEPPAPLQEAFLNGEFRLQNSDWSPDWPTAADTIRWFLVQGKEIDPDILGTISLESIQQIVHLTGPINIPEYHTMLDETNLYLTLQTKTEVNQFTGSTQKRDVIGAAGKALINKINTLNHNQRLAIVNYLLQQLNSKNILLNSTNPDFENLIKTKDWAGVLKPADPCLTTCISETVSVIEANLGANKSNRYIERLTTHQVSLTNQQLKHDITIDFKNTSEQENPVPPLFYGGNYINYIRFYLPLNAENITIDAYPTLPTTLALYPKPFDSSNQTGIVRTNSTYGFTEVGFFHITRSSSDSHLKISYTLPFSGQSQYQLHLLKQHGLKTSPQILNLFGQTKQTNLENDYSISSTISPHQ